MNLKEIKNFQQRLTADISAGRLLASLDSIIVAAEAGMMWEISDRVKTLRQHYGYMLGYFMDGVCDPEREKLRDSISDSALTALDLLCRRLLTRETPSLYYNTLRSSLARGIDADPKTLINKYLSHRPAKDDLFSKAMSGQSVSDDLGDAKSEQLEKDIFISLWTTFPISADLQSYLKDILTDNLVNEDFKLLLISALWLGGMEFFDTAALDILTDLYLAEISDEMRARTVMSLLLLLWRHRNRAVPQHIIAKIELMNDSTPWQRHVREAFIELIRTSGTQSLVNTLQNDIFNRISPEMINKLKDIPAADKNADPEEALFNPVWDKLLENSHIRDKMKELGEVQEEGGDVFLAAFARLKQFPFFNDISNWFIPYRVQHSAFNHPSQDMERLSEAVSRMPYLCDSDKYSTMLSMSMVPGEQIANLISQLDMASSMMEANGDNAIADDKKMKHLFNVYAKTLYRFYNFFRRKSEFVSPFDSAIALGDVPLLAPVFSDAETAAGIAEFYLKIKCWAEALAMFRYVDRIMTPDSARYQKMGLCAEKTGDFAKAVDYYERADLLDENVEWTLRRMMHCLIKLGEYNRAISYIIRLLELTPQERDLLFTLIQCYVAIGNGQKALPKLEEAAYLYEDDPRLPLLSARVYLLTGNYHKAGSFFSKVLDQGKADDKVILDAARCLWASGDIKQAAALYRALAKRHGANKFASILDSDRDNLISVGIDPSDIALMGDAVISFD